MDFAAATDSGTGQDLHLPVKSACFLPELEYRLFIMPGLSLNVIPPAVNSNAVLGALTGTNELVLA